MVNDVAQLDTPPLDTAVDIVTPENIAFQYRVAGPFRRLPAYLIDLAIRAGVFFAALIALSMFLGAMMSIGLPSLGSMAGGLFLVGWFALSWFYGGFFEAFFNGQTPGKRIMGIRVVTVDGQPINGLQAVLRNVLRVLDGQPSLFMLPAEMGIIGRGILTYQLALLTTMANNRFQRLGDLVCGTMVVIEERQWLHGVARIDDPDVVRLADRIPPSFEASRSLARALAAYVQRRQMFSLPRRQEIARHLAAPLCQRFRLPSETSPDQLLCAVYHRTFVTDHGAGNNHDNGDTPGQSPFASVDDGLPVGLLVGLPPGTPPMDEAPVIVETPNRTTSA